MLLTEDTSIHTFKTLNGNQKTEEQRDFSESFFNNLTNGKNQFKLL